MRTSLFVQTVKLGRDCLLKEPGAALAAFVRACTSCVRTFALGAIVFIPSLALHSGVALSQTPPLFTGRGLERQAAIMDAAKADYQLSIDRYQQGIAIPPLKGSLKGDWEFESNCAGQPVHITTNLFYNQPAWSTTVYYWSVAGGKADKILKSWNAKGYLYGNGDTLVLYPQYYTDHKIMIEKTGRDYGRNLVIFRWNGSDWTGSIDDPECNPAGPIRRPPPPALIVNGEAQSAAAWLGKSPMTVIGGKNFFQFSGFDPATALNATERTASWTPVSEGKAVFDVVLFNLSITQYVTVACPGGVCDLSKGGRAFLISPNDLIYQSSRVGNAMQFCSFKSSWTCTRGNTLPPAGLTQDRLTQWIWDARHAEGKRWRTANPGRRPDCGMMPNREDYFDRADPPPAQKYGCVGGDSGPPQPTWPKQ